MRSLDLDDLAAFAAVVELGGFSAAAKRLNLSQPAVSMRVRQLERRLSVRLVERIGRRVQPTQAALTLLPPIRLVHEAVAAVLAVADEQATGVNGRVRIGTGATACIYLLPPILRDLRQRYPRLEIVVRTGNTGEILRQLEENALDTAVVTLPITGRAFSVEVLADDQIVAMFPPEMALPIEITAQTLAVLPLLLFEPGGNSRGIIDDWFRRDGVVVTPVMELGSIEAIKQLVGAGLGCGLLPELAVARKESAAGLPVRPLNPPLYRQIGLVLRRDKVPDRALREVVAALRRFASDHSGNTSQTTPSRASRSSSSLLVGTS
jgi:DNA-binding transcriptional LysR family regulator